MTDDPDDGESPDDLLAGALEMAQSMRDATTVLDEVLQTLRQRQHLDGLQRALDGPVSVDQLLPYLCTRCLWKTTVDVSLPPDVADERMLLALADHHALVHGREESAGGQLARLEGWLHGRQMHPDWEYTSTTGPVKAWDSPDEPPDGAGWVRNTDVGRVGWVRFDYHEESYWRRRSGIAGDAGRQFERGAIR